ncbi:MAG TPA: hypothetical protein DE044_04200 [Alteromonas macleodii]|nr:hypothetical protein [Alteromonas macleodii]
MFKFLAIDLALKKPAPDRIILSTPGCLENDCFQIYLFVPSLNWKMLLQSKVDKGYGVFLWVDGGRGRDATVLLPFLEKESTSFEITHFYQGYEFIYTSQVKYILSRLFFKHKLVQVKDRVSQSVFNRKTLVRSERMELLRYLVERTVENSSFTTDSMSVGMYLHSNRWFHHPKRKEHQSHFRLLLDSLVSSGDLVKSDYCYSVTGQALATLSEYERDQQKHQDNVNNAKTAHALTRALILVGSLGILSQFYMWINSGG